MVERIVVAARMTPTTDIPCFMVIFPGLTHLWYMARGFFFAPPPRSRQKILVDQELRSLLDLQQRQFRGTCLWDLWDMAYPTWHGKENQENIVH